MEAASAAISSLGFTLDLMLHRVLTRIRKRSAQEAATLARGWLKLEAGWVRTREQGGRKITTELRWWESDESGSESDTRKKKGGWGQPRPGPPYLLGGPPNLPVVVPSAVQHASTGLF
jgi:hypothetical protein